MAFSRRWVLAASVLLPACGSESPDPATGVAATPVVQPTPTPSSSPTPTPAPTGITLVAEAASPLIGSIQYAEPLGSRTARWATDDAGRFPSTAVRLARDGIISSGFVPDYSLLRYRLSATGIDRDSRLLVTASAPVGASVISPLTSLIDVVGSQEAVRVALQLDSGPYAIPATSDLATLSGTSSESGVIVAANVRALLLSQAVYVAGRGFGADDLIPFTLQSRDAEVGAFIKANASTRLFSEAGAEQLLRTYADRSVDQPTIAALAHLVVAYAESITAIQSSPAQGTRYMLGLQSFFFYRARQLRTGAITAAAVQAIAPATLAAEVAAFGNYPAFSGTGTLFAGPDFDFLPPGGSGSRRRWNQARDGHGQIRTTGYAENDFTFNATTLTFEPVYTRGALVSVTVPAENAGHISADVQNSSIVYRALPGFTGTTYFDYVISDDLGQQASARFYVVVH